MELGYKRYDVVLVDFGKEFMDSEQSGVRPAIIIQNDIGNHFSKSTIVMPITTKHKNLNQPTHTLLKRGRDKGLVKDSMVLGECIRQVSEKRILSFLGKITDDKEKNEIKRVYLANFGE